jgi:DNA-directed RNA polymerase subunit M/transcription elongation factor TFIIS
MKPTADVPCQKCGQPHARWLEFTSTSNGVDTFQCLACGHIWTVKPSEPPKAALP